jgi:superfamily II DNA or RNA helicase
MPVQGPNTTTNSWRGDVSPRDWQREALQKWQENFRGIVKVVTGAGKTIFAEQCMRLFHEKYSDGKSIIIVPTIALLDQWVVSLLEDLNVRESEIACFSGEDKATTLHRVNIFVINTARKVAQYIRPQDTTFLIVDECHRAGSLVNSLALKAPHKATLGLSATPERDFDKGFEEHLVPSLGEIIFTYDYATAYRDKVIVPFELINVRVDMLPKEDEEYRKLTKRAAREFSRLQKEGGPDEKLRRILQKRAAVSATATMRIPVACAIVDQNKGKRALVFHERVEAANSLLDILLKRKHSATIYHTGVGPVIRRDNLRLYRRGMFDVLVSCRALDEGTNVPETIVAVIASSTSSQRQRIQRLGRVLRPSDGKTLASVYTLYTTDTEEKRLRAEEAVLEGVATVRWYKGKANLHG